MASATNVLSPQTLNIQMLSSQTDSGTMARGQTYYWSQRAKVESVSAREAVVLVRGTRPTPYRVDVRLDDGDVMMACDCPLSMGDPNTVCKHCVAAFLALRDRLTYQPVVTWETVLSKSLKDAPKKSTSAGTTVLVFSLQQGYRSWTIQPYSLSNNLVAGVNVENPDELARAVKRGKMSRQAKAVRNAATRRFVNASEEAARAAHLMALSNQTYYYSDDNSLVFETLLPQIAGCPLFLGEQSDPLRVPLKMLTEPGVPEMELTTTPDGLMLRMALNVDGKPIALDSKETHVVSKEPFWLLSGTTLMPVAGDAGAVLALAQTPELEIPREDEDAFLENYLLPLAERMPLKGSGIAWEDVEGAVQPRLYLSDDKEAGLKAAVRFSYGPYEVGYDKTSPAVSVLRRDEQGEAEGEGEGTDRKTAGLQLVRLQRQGETEQAAYSELLSGHGLKRGTEAGALLLRANTHPVDFLLKHIPHIADLGYEVYGEESLKAARVNRNAPTIAFHVSSGIDWWDLQAVVNFGDEQVGLKDIRRALKKRERYVKLADGSIGEIPADWLEKYRHLFALGEETDEGLRLSQHHLALVEDALEGNDAEVDAEFRRRRERLRSFTHIEPKELPKGFTGELRPYQKAGYDWLHWLKDAEFGGCLADDMGLGKTVQVLAFLLSLRESGAATGPDLIVMPRSLLYNWQREAAKFTPALKVLIHADASRAKDLDGVDDYDLVLTTYGIMLRDIEALKARKFNYVVLDESQAIKNPTALTGRAARLLNAHHKLVMTGTPVENGTMELWSQFAFLSPGLLGSAEYFRSEFATPIEKRQDEDAAALLRRLVHPFILRRTKDQVAQDLPPRTERTVITEMEPAQRKAYNEKRDYYRAMLLGMIEKEGLDNARMKVLEGLLRLRQICNHPKLAQPEYKGGSAKLETLIETLETLRSEGHKALVFSQFTQMLALVRKELDDRAIPYAYLDGQTKDRQERVDAFQSDPSLPFFLISLKAGGVGLNLTAADYVIHIDPWWNPAVEMQATDRTHRIGQDKPVFVYKMITADSVEEKILQLQDKKRALVSQLISTESGFFKSLTKDDIQALFTA